MILSSHTHTHIKLITYKSYACNPFKYTICMDIFLDFHVNSRFSMHCFALGTCWWMLCVCVCVLISFFFFKLLTKVKWCIGYQIKYKKNRWILRKDVDNSNKTKKFHVIVVNWSILSKMFRRQWSFNIPIDING
jgi:hypothetical protein